MAEYNGWRNRETWLVNVWFGDYFADLAESGEIWSADDIRGYIEEYVDNAVPNEIGGFIADMIDLNCIDYDALAEHLEPVA